MKAIIGALASVITLVTNSHAQNPNTENAWSNLQMEVSTCIAYYNYLKICTPDDQKDAMAKKVEPVIKDLTKMAFAIGSKIGMTNDAMLARLKMSYEAQGKALANKCFNFSALYEEHGERCRKVAEQPLSVMQEYQNKN